jgi:hypothetical protein
MRANGSTVVVTRFFPLQFANPEVFPHHYLFVWGRGTLPLRQFLF